MRRRRQEDLQPEVHENLPAVVEPAGPIVAASPFIKDGALAAAAMEEMQDLRREAAGHAMNARAANTRRAYDSDWRSFTSWCDERGFTSLPAHPEVIVSYLADLGRQGKKMSTVTRHLTTITRAHKMAGHPSPRHNPLVSDVVRGMENKYSVAKSGKDPLLVDHVRAMVSQLGEGLSDIRDRALVLVGFSGGFRRSELVGLDVEDVRFVDAGMAIRLRRSKTDQKGEGRPIGIHRGEHLDTCPVRALQMWLAAAGVTSGPIFRGLRKDGDGGLAVKSSRLCDKTVADVVKRLADAAGIDKRLFSGHSLRSGFATAAAVGDASEASIMKQTGHKTSKMVRHYIRDADLFRDNASRRLGL